MNKTILNFHTSLRSYCIERMTQMYNQQIVTQRKVYGIYEKTQAMTEEQISEAICERFKGISRKEYDALVNNKELRKHDYSVNRGILDVILKGIEGLEPEDYHTLNEWIDAVVKVVKECKISPIKGYGYISQEDKERISACERQRLITFILDIEENKLNDVPPLFYRRVLTDSKRSEVFQKLQNIWLNKTVQHYNISTDEIVCFYSEQFIKGVNLEQFIEWLVSHGEERIYEINTCEVDAGSYIMDTTALVIKSKLEAYWCSDKMDWALIKDHEGFIFVCGKWLVEVLKSEDATSQLHL